MPPSLFTLIELRDVKLPNRVVLSPMCQYTAEDGLAGDWHLMHYGQYAVSGPGLLVFEATAVEPRGRITPHDIGLWSDECAGALERVVRFCKAHGGSALGIQLAHAGRKGSDARPWEESGPVKPDDGGWKTVAPSAIPYDDGWPAPEALTEKGLDEVKSAFVAAAGRAVDIGFELIELHMAHGYLLHQFLSPLTNRREDARGGSPEGRARLPLEVFRAVREAVPGRVPVGVRISASDYAEGGVTVDDSVGFVGKLMEAGCDFVDVSGGGLVPFQKIEAGPGFQVPMAGKIRKETGAKVMAVGMITEADHAESIVASGQADMVALARVMLHDPRWAWHAAAELGSEDVFYPPQYLRCRPDKWPPAKE